MTIETITSLQNARVKQLVTLQQKSSERKKNGMFVVEGQREIEHCIEAGFQIEALFFCPAITGSEKPAIEGCKCFSVSTAIYDKIAYRGGTEGMIATVRVKTTNLSDLKLSDKPLIVVLERVEKPGNLGAILRSADASAADAVIICDPLTDLYNPNLIRSSLGGIFSVPCVACTSQECIAFLKEKGIQILTAQLQDSRLYYDIDMQCATAIVMGTESTGLTNQWRQAASDHIRIPMLGRLDSLNVSVSTAILLFEAVRQRQN